MLRLNKLTVSIAGQHVCRNLSFKLEPGMSLGILGLNGSGKTTLLHTVAGFIAPEAGEVLIEGQNVHKLKPRLRARKIACLLQNQEFNFPFSVLDSLTMTTYANSFGFDLYKDVDYTNFDKVLRAVNLKSKKHQDVRCLSGGEKQRLALAMLMLQDPDIYLLDEPTNNLDLSYISLIKELATNQDKISIMILHNLQLATEICTHILLLKSGEYRFGLQDEVLQKSNLEWVYATRLKEVMAGDYRFYIG